MKYLPYSENTKLKNISVFGGITAEHTASDGDLLDSVNLTSDKYPLLTPRRAMTRYTTDVGDIKCCIQFLGKLAVFAENGYLYWNGNSYNIGNAAVKFAVLGNYLCGFAPKSNGFYIHSYPTYYTVSGGIMVQTSSHDDVIDVQFIGGSEGPDSAKLGDIWINYSGIIYEYTSTGWTKTGSKATVGKVYRAYITEDLTYISFYKRYNSDRYEVLYFSPCDSEGNEGSTHIKLECATTAWLSAFNVGDFVRIYDANPSNTNEAKKPVYAALSDGVTVTAVGSGYIVVACPSGHEMISDRQSQSGDLRIERCAPMLEHICVHNNRLYGAVSSTIYISALGNPTQFSNYSLSSASPWAVDTGGEEFTGCISYDNSVVFFKEREIYRVYGDTPSEFRFTKIVCPGVSADSSMSLAVSSGYLYYNSYSGVMRYGGGYPVCISTKAGINVSGAVSGADDVKYYMHVDGLLYVYDTRYGIWHKETLLYRIGSFYNIASALMGGGYVISGELGEEYTGTVKGVILSCSSEAAINSEAVFADITEGTLYRKSYKRIRLRVKVDSGTLRVFIAYDGGEKKLLLELGADDAGEKNIQKRDIIPERCDSLRICLEGDGMYTVYAIDREYEVSTDEG